MKIMVFLHGTAIMHISGLGVSREERVKQVIKKDPAVYEYMNYVPVGDANKKLNKWVAQGAEIIYLSSHENVEDIKKDLISLAKHNFPDGPVLYRRSNETYAVIAERVMPDILIEDDCESIGGEIEMTYPHMHPNKKKSIKSIVIQEFAGIDNLPDDLDKLIRY